MARPNNSARKGLFSPTATQTLQWTDYLATLKKPSLAKEASNTPNFPNIIQDKISEEIFGFQLPPLTILDVTSEEFLGKATLDLTANKGGVQGY